MISRVLYLQKTYGEKEAAKQVFNWRLFFMFCSEVFNYEDGNEWIIAQHVFTKRPQSNM